VSLLPSPRNLLLFQSRRLATAIGSALVILAWTGAPASAQVQITPHDDSVRIDIDGQPFTDFILKGGNAMKPYLYPLRSATGKLVTRKFPNETVPGEPKDHPHQRGLWFAHERVNGFDFWNNEADYKTANRGRIVVTKVSDVQNGPDAGSFKAALEWVDPDGVKLLDETRTMTFRKTPTLRIIDLDLTLTPVGEVTFGDAKDGAFGIRLAAALEEPGNAAKGSTDQIPGTGTITNAEGGEREKAVWGKPSDWIDYSGEIEGEKVGVAVFDHPGNAHRTRWHVRGYGLLAANPFGLKVFTGDKTQDGSVTLKPGESLRFRYRVIIHPGDVKSAGIGSLWDEYVKESK
jgi:hypothetical protein